MAAFCNIFGAFLQHNSTIFMPFRYLLDSWRVGRISEA